MAVNTTPAIRQALSPALDLAALPGHPFVAYAGSELHVEGVALSALARQYGTPLFVYSKAAMHAALAGYQRGLAGRDALICYAMKANPSLAVLRYFVQSGCGLDVTSAGELARALRAGADPEKVIFSGVGKTQAEMRYALNTGIACFNVESVAELETLSAVAQEMGKIAPVSLRVNPDVDPQTHPYISTGLRANKFGIAHSQALQAYRLAAALRGVQVKGVDCHIGSQITEVAPFVEALDKVLDLVALVEAEGIPLPHLDFGGGLGITYASDRPPEAEQLWTQLLARIDARGYGDRRLVVEPGRSLTGNAGVCVTQVQYLKHAAEESGKNFCIVDAAMNDLPRPAMYQAFHGIVACQMNPAPQGSGGMGAAKNYDVVGPVCESGDWIGRERALDVRAGDFLAVLSAGAYCMSMSSTYNSRPRAAEVWVEGTKVSQIRRRETWEDLMAMEE